MTGPDTRVASQWYKCYPRLSIEILSEPISQAFDVQRLRVLLAVARHGSMSRAADELYLSQPTVSLHMKSLREMLGTPVVEQRGRRMELTEAGRILEHHAVRALAELEQAREEIERHKGIERGRLSIGAGTTPGTYLLPELLGRFQSRHPAIELHLEVAATGTIVEKLRRGELHLGVVGETGPHKDIEQRALLPDRLVCIVPPGHSAARRGRITRPELRDAALLAREQGSSTQAVADRYLRRLKLEPARRWELDSPEAIKQAVRAGLGIAFVSDLTVRDETAAGTLVGVGVQGAKPPTRTIDLVRSANRYLTPAERAFIALLDQAASTPGEGGAAALAGKPGLAVVR